MRRYYVLDALRCLLALCVAVGHAGVFPLFGVVGQHDVVLDMLARGWRTTVYGPAAVIAFFVISGFCIHFPFARRTKASPVIRFYARRYIRILVPVTCTVVLFKIALPSTVIFGSGSILWHSTLWSIVCEELYYAVYPLLNRASKKVGWSYIVIASLVPAIFVCWYYFPAVDWQDIGVVPTALTLFPVWLSGCYMAENLPALLRTYSPRGIWLWRAAAWVTMWAALVLHSHTIFHQTVTGIAVGIVYYFWLRAEISFYLHRKPWRVLVWAGQWSYSLYLIHPLAIAIGVQTLGLSPQSRLSWLVLMSFTLLSSYVFYLLIERPSHKLAKRIPMVDRAPLAPAPEVA